MVGNGIVVALGSAEPDEDYIAFNQNSPFNYLTGFTEPEAALVFQVRNGQIAGKEKLFVEPSDPAREVWTGQRLGLPGVERTPGLEPRESRTLIRVLDSLLTQDSTALVAVVGNYGPGRQILSDVDQLIVRAVTPQDVGPAIKQATA